MSFEKPYTPENPYIQPQGIWKSEGQKPLEGVEKHKGMGDRVEYLINQEFLDPQGSGRQKIGYEFQVDPDLVTPELESRPHVKLDIKIEEELIAMTAEEAAEMGMSSHIDVLITAAYELLGLMTYFTTGETETRGWTIPRGSTAPQAGAAIHTDFAEKFIRAEVVGYDDFVQYGGWSGARDSGKFRLEGKEYIVKDGDLMVFKV